MENPQDIYYPPLQNALPVEPVVADPDNPPWGVVVGVAVWLASFIFAVIAGGAFFVFWMFFVQEPPGRMPQTPEAINALQEDAGFMFYQIISTLAAHLMTFALCWAIATRFGKRSFSEAIGWRWHEPSIVFKLGLVFGTVALAIAASVLLRYVLPDTEETPFNKILKLSAQIRYAVAVMAVLTAPLVEELVYRCFLYAPLKRAIGTGGAVALVTLLFAAIHVPQYVGAWASLTGLLLLSLALTVIRAKTKSLFPCFAIHTVFNLVGAIGIVMSGST